MYQQRSDKLKWVWVLVVIGFMGWLYWQNQQLKDDKVWFTPAEPDSGQVNITKEIGEEKIGVHIAGAVHRPGVYFLPQNARVVDLIKAAGGVTRTADLNQINLAQPLMDGQKVVVPEKQDNITTRSIVIKNSERKVNINTASKEELMTLPGIGPGKAAAIIGYREMNGSFRKLEDLMNVDGIGEKTFIKLKDKITLY
ncbi:hypothetical protein BBF96_07270 [Anoxybacter fermentans]|uniref:Helix-hairpin-helix DNA-binding motif class 1 domain-containing protein n=1 Tax=Anoxybacter fermentans TaxID=1323375 RepID=A0A3Q9HQ53_9FIRM|nr:helix-hairpin-helix domain-containing protein [Anoxybacter fermentans]AZR73202.1 hypothetical protein BBF96_07270 [Anoxybacter fermentans]